MAADEPVGFVDDTHAVVMGTQPRWWIAASEPRPDPWAATTPVNPATSVGAAGGGLVVLGHGSGLELATPARTRYLGWQDIGAQTAAFQDGRIVVTFGPSRLAWLDDALVEHRRAELTSTATHVQALDEHHAVYAWQVSDEQHVEIVDLDHADHLAAIGSFKTISRFDYEPRTHVLGIGDGVVEHRWALDVATLAAKRLPDVTVPANASTVRLVDPANADGAEVIAASYDGEVTRLPGGKTKKLPGFVIAVDEGGHVFTRDNTSAWYRDGAVFTAASADLPVPDHAGKLVASIGASGLRLLDGNAERWKAPIWGVYSAAFSDDDTKLLVRAMGGLVMIDVASGERLATACGWSFGLFDKPTASATVGQGSVCEDDER